MTQTAETPTGLDALPKKLSPSRAKDFEQCPYKFKQKVILHRREPNTAATTRGTIAHEALENLFKNHPQGERTVEAALQYVEPAWDGIKDKDNYKHLIPEQDDILDFARQCVQNYFTIENPNRFDPAGLEQYISTDLDDGLTVHGYIDRVDEVGAQQADTASTYISDYKGLAVDTPIPTPDGWSTMGDLQAGDMVLGTAGHAVNVTKKSGVHHRPCYELTFTDGSSVVCDNVHLWRVQVVRHRYATPTKTGGTLYSGAQPPEMMVVDSDELFELRRTVGPESIYIDTCKPLDRRDRALPLDPWMLGAWLGDGSSRAGDFAIGDADVRDMMALLGSHWETVGEAYKSGNAWQVTCGKPIPGACGYGHPMENVSGRNRCKNAQSHDLDSPTRYNQSLSGVLRGLNLLHNKHIPQQYLRASYRQRLELLQGLMDTDGSWNPLRRRAVFVTTLEPLASGVVELLRTFGINPQHFKKRYRNPVRDDRTAHYIEFRPMDLNPFQLPRKAEQVEAHLQVVKRNYGLGPAKAYRRTLASMSPVSSVPTQCIAVDAEDSMYLAGHGFIPTHNTGKLPNPRYLNDAFFAMKLYALVLRETTGKTPYALRLVYIKHTGKEAVRFLKLTDEILDQTRAEIQGIWTRIKAAAAADNWPTKTGPLCNWCYFQDKGCPAFANKKSSK